MKKPVVVVVVLALVAVAVVLWINNTLNSQTRMLIEDLGPRVTGSDVTVEGIDLSIVGGGGSVTNVIITNPDGFQPGPALRTKSAQVTLQSGSVWSPPVIVKALVIDEVLLTYEPGTDVSNLEELLDNVQTLPSQNPSENDIQLVIEGLRVVRAVVQSPDGSVLLELPEMTLDDIGDATDGTTATLARAQVLRHVLSTAIDGLREKGPM